MIPRSARRAPFVLSTLAAVLAVSTAGLGLLDLDVYRPLTPERMIPGVVSQDLLSVAAGIGVMVCIAAIRSGREKAWLVWVGLLGYLVYAYALYAFDRLYNGFFLAYVAILGLSIYALMTFFARADAGAVVVAERRPPRRATAVLLAGLLVLFVSLWLTILLPAMASRTPPDGSAIFVLDLSFVLPLLGLEAVLLWRKAPLGDLLAVPILAKMTTLGLSVLLGTLLAPWFGGEFVAGDVIVYALLGVAPIALLVPYYRRLSIAG